VTKKSLALESTTRASTSNGDPTLYHTNVNNDHAYPLQLLKTLADV